MSTDYLKECPACGNAAALDLHGACSNCGIVSIPEADQQDRPHYWVPGAGRQGMTELGQSNKCSVHSKALDLPVTILARFDSLPSN